MSVDLVLDRDINTTGQFVKDKNGNVSSLSLTSDKVGIGAAKPQAQLDVVGKAQIHDGSGYAVKKGYMASGSLTIGSHKANYGGGQKWNANTAGLLLETKDNTEIAAHDAGTRVASLMYFEGHAANRITIGRDMGWGAIAQTIVYGNVGVGAKEPGQKLVVEGTHNAGKHAGNPLTYGGQLGIKGNAPQIDFIDTDHQSWAIHVNANKLLFVREPWDYKDLVLDGAGNVGIGTDAPRAKLEVVGKAMIHDGSGNDSVARNYMASGSLTIGSNKASYGGGQKWNANTAGLLLETLDNTEIAVHDAGTRVASLMYFEGAAANRITIGRDMGWGAIAQTVLYGNVGVGAAEPGQKLVIEGPFNAGRHAGTNMTYGGQLAIKSNAPQIDFIDTDAGHKDWSIHVNANKLFFIREPWEATDLVLDGAGNVGIGTAGPKATLDVVGKAQIHDSSASAVDYMAPGSLTIGSTTANYGGGRQFNASTAGLLLETKDNTEIAVHDAGTRVASLMYFEGHTTNRITIGRDMGWGAIAQTVLHGKVGVGTENPETRLDVVGTGGGAYPVHFRVNGRLHAQHKQGGMWVGPERTRLIGAVDEGIGLYVNKVWHLVVQKNGYVGLGTRTPSARLEVAGQVKITGGSPGAGKVLTSDANGLASWKAPAAAKGGSLWSQTGKNIYYDAGNVGVGTAKPAAKLHVVGGAIMPAVGNSKASGIFFPENAFGGSGDAAWIRYYARSGEATTFEIGTSNDANDHIALMASGNVGVGTTKPAAKLHVVGGDINTNRYLRISAWSDDATRYGTGSGSIWYRGKGGSYGAAENSFIVDKGNWIVEKGNIGVGTTKPDAKLVVAGQVKITGGSPGAGKVLTSDAKGLASWKAPAAAKGGSLWSQTGKNIYYDAGNVGVGTAKPAAKLHVVGGAIMPAVGNSKASGIFFPENAFGGSGDAAWIRYYARSGEATTFEIGTSNDANDHIALMASGNVGVGTTKPAAKLHVVGGDINTNRYLRISAWNDNAAQYGTGSGSIWYRGEGGSHGSSANSFIIDKGNWIVQKGNVGVGTLTPAVKLHIKGSVRLDGGEIQSWGKLDFHPDVDKTGDDVVRFLNSDGAENMRVHSNGNVGIGTAKPTQKLSVYDGEFVLQTEDNTHDQSILFQNSAGAYTWRLYRTDAGNHYADFRIAGGLDADFNALTDYFSIDKDGNVNVKGAITAARFVGDGSGLAGTQAGGDGAAAAPTGDIVATNVSVAPANNQRGAYFLATLGDFNHAVYNNLSNIDGEGAWDGSKWNCYAGLNVRVGAGKDKKSALYINNLGNVGLGTEQPKGRFSVTGRGAQGWIAADLGDAEQGDRVVMGTFPRSTKAVVGAHNHALTAWADLLLNPAGGNVGIGTMAPVARMDIAQAKRTGTHPKSVRGLYVTGNWSEGSGGVEFRHTNGTQGIGFGYNTIYATGANADQHLNLLPRGTGGVGIGTKKPAAKVHIINQSQDGNGNTLILGPTNQSNLRLGYHQSYSWIQSHGSKPLVLNPVGNFVGIGTTEPAAKVHIEGGSDAKPTGGGYLVIGALNSENIVLDNNEIMARKNGAIAPLYFQAEGGDLVVHYHRKKGGVVIKDNDNVGIGTLAPDAKLHVVGQVKITGGSPGAGKVLTSDADGLASWQAPAAANGSSTASLAKSGLHQADGNLGIGTENPEHPLEMGSGAYCSAGGAWTNAASREVLENIQELPTDAALAALGGLTPVQFTYKAAPDEAHLGFVAEDVPALVAGDGKGLSPMDLVALLTRAVQEQQKAIAALAAQSNGHAQASTDGPGTGGYGQETLHWGGHRAYDWQWKPWDYEWPPVTGKKRRLKRVR